jgi:hypothetical protein
MNVLEVTMAATHPLSACVQNWRKLSIDTLLETDLEQRIRNRAYELYEARGREDGHAVDDWLRAEQQIWELH